MSSTDRETQPMSLRSTDPRSPDTGAPIFKITREITPWQLGGAAVVVAVFAATVWFTLRAQGEKLDTVASDVKQVLATQQAADKVTTDIQYEIRDLKRRVGDIEKVKP